MQQIRYLACEDIEYIMAKNFNKNTYNNIIFNPSFEDQYPKLGGCNAGHCKQWCASYSCSCCIDFGPAHNWLERKEIETSPSISKDLENRGIKIRIKRQNADYAQNTTELGEVELRAMMMDFQITQCGVMMKMFLVDTTHEISNPTIYFIKYHTSPTQSS